MLKGDFQIDNEWMLKRNLKSFEYIKISSKGGKIFVVVQALIRVQLFATPWNIAHQASLSFTISPSLLKFMSIESVMPSNNIILCPLLLLLPSVFPSIREWNRNESLEINLYIYAQLLLDKSAKETIRYP